MPRWGMVIDLDKCVGCQTCSAACRMENNVPSAGPEQAAMGRAIFWNEVIYDIEGEYPNAEAHWHPRPCMHCENSPCQKVCPVGATYVNEDGAVLVNWDRCIGCRYCTVACPYGARSFNWYKPHYTEAEKASLNPAVPVRPRGVVEKCTFCSHRIRQARKLAEQGEPSPLHAFMKGGDDRSCSQSCHEHPAQVLERPASYDFVPVPACVQACPVGARVFGDLEDPKSTVSQLARSPRAYRLLEHLGTEPKTYYLREEKWDETT